MSELNKKETKTKESDQQKVFHLKEIREINKSRVGNEVSAKLMQFGCKLVWEVTANGTISARVVDDKGKDFCTFDDFDRTFAVGGILRDVLEKTGTGGLGEDVIRKLAAYAVKKGTEGKMILLPGNKGQTGVLANHLKNLQKIEEAFSAQERLFSENALVGDFRILINTAYYILGRAHIELADSHEKTLSKDIYPAIQRDTGMPEWFMEQVKSPKDFLQNVGANKPYRLFFQSKGKGSITLKISEWGNQATSRLIPNVLANSEFVSQIVLAIKTRDMDFMKVLIPYAPNATDEAALESMGWPVVPSFIDAEDFLDQKSKKKLCEFVPWGSTTYKSSLERIRVGLVRALFLETSRIEDNGSYWSAIMDKPVVQEQGVFIWDTARGIAGVDINKSVNNFWKFSKTEYWDSFMTVFKGSLTAFSGGAIDLAVTSLFGTLTPYFTLQEPNVAEVKELRSNLNKSTATKNEIKRFNEIEELIFIKTYVHDQTLVVKFNGNGPDKADYWSPEGAHTLTPNLNDDEKLKALELSKMLLESKVFDPDIKILPNHPISEEVKSFFKKPDNKASLKSIDGQARGRLTKLISSFSHTVLQMDVASTVVGTIHRFKQGIDEDDADKNKEEAKDLLELIGG